MAEEMLGQRKRVLRRLHTPNTITNNQIEYDSFSFTPQNHHQQQQYGMTNRRKNEGLICSICQGPAHGYNFDAITCESCKAFFRRNALKSKETFKCRLNAGQCVINMATRKRCKACRLTKCFEIGMRADWILTDEERLVKRQKIEENRRLRQMLYPDSPETNKSEYVTITNKINNFDVIDKNLLSSLFQIPSITKSSTLLSSGDYLKIQQIQQAYTDSVRLTSLSAEIPSYPNAVRLNQTSDMINLPTNMQATRVIAYLKLLPEFCALNDYDKLILTKYNTFALVVIRAALNYDPLTDTYHEPNTNDCVFHGRDLIECFSLEQYENMTRCVLNLLQASYNDRLILQIFIIIILFSKGAAICSDRDELEPVSRDILSIFHMQNIFIDLLWKYCENKYGYLKTIEIWLQLTATSIDTHYQAFKTRRDFIQVDEVASLLTPLMKSVMLII